MNKIVKFSIGTVLISVLAVLGIGATSPQLIQSFKEKVFLQDSKDTKNEGVIIIDDNFDFSGDDSTASREDSRVKGESTVANDSYKEPSQWIPTSSPTQTHTQNTNYVPLSLYEPSNDTGPNSDPYWDWQIRKAEEEARESEEMRKQREANDEYCKEINAQRSAAVAPIQAQINSVLAEMDRQKAEIDARTDLSETDKNWAKMKISGGELFDQWMDLQAEYNSVYAQYGSC